MSVLGYFQSGYFNLGLVTTVTGTPGDFLGALVAYWQADAYLTAIVPTPYLGKASAKVPKPYVVITEAVGQADGRNTGTGYWDDLQYTVAIWNTSADQAVAWAQTVLTEFNKLVETKLTFSSGYQMTGLYKTRDTIARALGFGAGASIDFPVTLSYKVRVGRTR